MRQRGIWSLVAVAVVFAAGWWQAHSATLEPLLSKDAVTVLAAEAGAPELHAVGVAYFYNKADQVLEPVAFRLPRAVPPDQLAAIAFDTLCQGPPRGLPALTTDLPPGCRVQQVWLEDGLLHVRFAPGAGVLPATRGLRQDQLEMTAAQIRGVRRLQLWDGDRPWALGPIPVDGRPDYVRLRPQP